LPSKVSPVRCLPAPPPPPTTTPPRTKRTRRVTPSCTDWTRLVPPSFFSKSPQDRKDMPTPAPRPCGGAVEVGEGGRRGGEAEAPAGPAPSRACAGPPGARSSPAPRGGGSECTVATRVGATVGRGGGGEGEHRPDRLLRVDCRAEVQQRRRCREHMHSNQHALFGMYKYRWRGVNIGATEQWSCSVAG
jgi:hypothetical protein